MTHEVIREICKTFVEDLLKGAALDRSDIFSLVDEAAQEHGYKIAAQQQGIHGTVLSFVKEEPSEQYRAFGGKK